MWSRFTVKIVVEKSCFIIDEVYDINTTIYLFTDVMLLWNKVQYKWIWLNVQDFLEMIKFVI